MTGPTFDAAIREAGRRRLRTIAAGGGAVAVAVALLGLVPHAVSTTGLAPAGTPPGSRATTTTAPAGSPAPPPVVRATGDVPWRPGVTPSPDLSASPAAMPSPPVTPTAPPSGTTITRTGPTLRYTDPPDCVPGTDQTTTEGTRYGDWCLTAFTSDSGGITTMVGLDVCSLAPAGGTLGFDDRQVEFMVYDPDEWLVWDPDPRDATERPDKVDVKYGECVTWAAKWDRTDDRGRPLPAGSYTLLCVLHATNVPAGDSVKLVLPS